MILLVHQAHRLPSSKIPMVLRLRSNSPILTVLHRRNSNKWFHTVRLRLQIRFLYSKLVRTLLLRHPHQFNRRRSFLPLLLPLAVVMIYGAT